MMSTEFCWLATKVLLRCLQRDAMHSTAQTMLSQDVHQSVCHTKVFCRNG